MSDTMPERIWVAPTVGNVGHQGQGRTWYSMTPVGGTIEYVRADTRTVPPAAQPAAPAVSGLSERERCARIAERAKIGDGYSGHYVNGFLMARNQIVAAIRAQKDDAE